MRTAFYLVLINIVTMYNWCIYLKLSNSVLSIQNPLKLMGKSTFNLHGLWTMNKSCQLNRTVWHYTVLAIVCTASECRQLLMPVNWIPPPQEEILDMLQSNLTDHPVWHRNLQLPLQHLLLFLPKSTATLSPGIVHAEWAQLLAAGKNCFSYTPGHKYSESSGNTSFSLGKTKAMFQRTWFWLQGNLNRMPVVDHFTVTTHHVVRWQTHFQERGVIFSFSRVQVNGRLVFPVSIGENQPPLHSWGTREKWL